MKGVCSMTEYISKQKVLDYLNGYLHSLGEDADTLFNRGQRRALTNSIQDILSVKPADVQPMKHGEWVYNDKPIFGNPYGRYCCSICGSTVVSGDDNYCPCCGAKMIKDGETNEQDS